MSNGTQQHHRLHPRKTFTIAGAALRLNACPLLRDNMTADRPRYNRLIANQSSTTQPITHGWNAMTEILIGRKLRRPVHHRFSFNKR
jgi:hypothetical protein